MKKIGVSLAIIVLLILPLFLIREKVGNVLPVILPPKKIEVLSPPKKTTPKIQEVSGLPLELSSGFSLGVFAQDLAGPRALLFTPEGTLLVSLTSAGKIVALSDTQNTGVADKIKTLKEGLQNPHGLAFSDGFLYVAEETRVSRFNWEERSWELTNQKILLTLPKGGRHFTRSLVFDKNGKMYITIGSTCDVCVEANPWHGVIIMANKNGSSPRLFAKGLRNSVFLILDPKTGEVWATEMGRDWLGDNEPPDEINIIKDGGDYGWPFCYGDKVYDQNFGQGSPEVCQKTIAPIFKIPAHSAPLGLTFINSPQFPQDWQGDLLVAYHGSWNRSVPTGYKIVHLKVQGNNILSAEDFLTGFLQGNQAFARPVDLTFDKKGSLYISDDKGGYIFKVVGNTK